jgi:mannosyl-oligosaccharide alpha-1,2-mannosidase
MGLKSEYQRAKDWVKEKLVFQQAKKMVSFFETVIRLVGGLLSAYEVDPDQMYLTKCVELTDRLMHAFGPFGLPLSQINLATGDAKPASWARSNVLLAEVGTIQLEFCYLSEQTGDSTYAEAAERVIDIIDGERLDFPGLPRLYLNPNTGRFDANSGVSMGAIGDSYYEYLLKMWIWKNKKDPQYKRMYLAAMDGMFAKLIGEAPARKGGKRMFIGELDKRGSQVRKMDHLACFVPGMLALGLMHGVTDDPAVSDQHFRAAEELTDTCYAMYKLVPTGLAPESVQFLSSGMQVYVVWCSYACIVCLFVLCMHV